MKLLTKTLQKSRDLFWLREVIPTSGHLGTSSDTSNKSDGARNFSRNQTALKAVSG